MSQLQRDSRAVPPALTYDANNRLLTEGKTEYSETVTTTYTYDANGNTLSKSTPAHGEDEASSTTYTYNGFNQLIALTVDGTDVAYAYNAQGIRTAKRVNNLRTAYLLDGGNVVAEVQNNTVTDNYLRGANLIRRTSSSEIEYYLFNAHGDVVTTTNPNGTINQEYDYDAFGNEKNPDALDSNPFRYCGEYLDFETGTYYLRARYYDPSIGRFTQQDTHWNTANMIYGDNPQKVNELEDKLGLKTYTMVPQIEAVLQSGNLYVYCMGNPILYADYLGRLAGAIIGLITGAAGNALGAIFKGQNVGAAMVAGALGGLISGICADVGVAFTVTSSGIGIIGGYAITMAGALLGGAIQSMVEQMLNGAKFSELDLTSILISGGLSGAFSLVGLGLGSVINSSFNVTDIGAHFLEDLAFLLTKAGLEWAAVTTILTFVFVELDKATLDAIITWQTN